MRSAPVFLDNYSQNGGNGRFVFEMPNKMSFRSLWLTHDFKKTKLTHQEVFKDVCLCRPARTCAVQPKRRVLSWILEGRCWTDLQEFPRFVSLESCVLCCALIYYNFAETFKVIHAVSES